MVVGDLHVRRVAAEHWCAERETVGGEGGDLGIRRKRAVEDHTVACGDDIFGADGDRNGVAVEERSAYAVVLDLIGGHIAQ